VQVLEHKLGDDAFASAIIDQNASNTGGKVRVEFGGDEVFWALSDNYTFEMLQQAPGRPTRRTHAHASCLRARRALRAVGRTPRGTGTCRPSTRCCTTSTAPSGRPTRTWRSSSRSTPPRRSRCA